MRTSILNGKHYKYKTVYDLTSSGGNCTGAASTKYISISGITRNAADSFMRVGCEGIFRNMRVKFSGVPGVGEEFTCTLWVGGAATAVECVVAGGSMTCEDETHEAAAAKNNAVYLKIVSSAGAAATKLEGGSVEFHHN